jgi:plasmid stability protein
MKSLMEGHIMSTMMIRNIDQDLECRLRKLAAIHGRTWEDEAREILLAALPVEVGDAAAMFRAIRRRVEAVGGIDIELPARNAVIDPCS